MNKKKPAPLSHCRALGSTAQDIAGLRRWYESRQGQYALGELHATVQAMTADVFGYYALQVGLLAEHRDFLRESRISHCFSLSPDLDAAGVDMLANAEALPVAFDNIDLVVGFHVLDYAHSPHQVLREIERVLVPEGHCILIGFNPFSFRGVAWGWNYLRSKQGVPSLYGGFRIRDWFSILGFEVVETRTVGFRPGWGGEQIFKRLEWMERLGGRYQQAWGNIQVIHVRKQVSRLTPIKQTRQPRRILKPGMAVNSGTGRVTLKEQENS